MKAAAAVLITAALVIWLAPPAYLVGVFLRDLLHDRADKARREQQAREVSPEWLAVLAATDTPIFAEVWAESLRRDLEEWSA